MDTSVILALASMVVCVFVMAASSGNVAKKEDEVVFENNFTRGGDFFAPEKLIFTPTMVTHKRNHGAMQLYLSSTSHSIPNNKITGFCVTQNALGCDIEIVGSGLQSILATNFTASDTKTIEEIVNIIIEDYQKHR